jgi:stearoyl-CoA desaturase (Delta-9 desaturase)
VRIVAVSKSPLLSETGTEVTYLSVADPAAERSIPGENAQRVSAGMQVANFVVVVVPFLGLFGLPMLLWGRGFSWIDLGLLLSMYVLTALGITVGFHRFFTHRAFETGQVVQFILGVLGSMAVQGPLFKWVATHRRHHQYSDRHEDPHSPHQHGRGIYGVLRGAWHAHLGWLFQPEPPDLHRYVKDLQQSRMLHMISALFPLWVMAGLLIPAVLGGLLTNSSLGVVSGLVWGGLVRIFAVHHVTWSINSICHLWGSRPYRSDDQSRDNVVFGVLGLGEGWHHTHHVFPTSARHGLRWWQLDMSYWVIRALEFLGLAWNVKVPPKQAQAAQRV